MLACSIRSPGTTGTEEPPGITALSWRPFQTPPARASRSVKGIPSETSKLPGLSTWPDTENALVPPALVVPRSANHSPPLRMIDGTEDNDSVLLMVVGRP